MKVLKLDFGVFAPKISEQLKKYQIRNGEELDRDAEAISWLHIGMILTEVETKSARKRLIKKAKYYIKKGNQ